MYHGARQPIDLFFFWWSFLAYSLACVLYVAYFGLNKKAIARSAPVFMGIGLGLHTAALVSRTMLIHHLPLTNMFEYINIFSWFATCFYFIFLKIYKQHILGALSHLLFSC